MRILVYDGDCPFCRKASRLIVRLGLVSEEGRRTLADLTPVLARLAEEAGIAKALVVIDTETLETRSAARGLLWLVADTRLRFLSVLLARPPFLPLLEAAYRFVAKHRYSLIRPSRSAIRCDCG